ncbi:MAG: molybdenum cofactor biosynthesis protein B [Myxococcota bacterium]|nr:molybdenum cofactor biosynthesis protein B [Myxococcota bacterium]
MKSLGIAVLTVSDTRTRDTDRSGRVLIDCLEGAGHRLVDWRIVSDEMELLVDTLKQWVADPDVQVILTTGGTGLTGRDMTPEAVRAVITKEIPGFGELFRWLSYAKIGTSTIQSRAVAGVAINTYVFALPGSPSACRDAWDDIICFQLDSDTKPCNLVQLIPRLEESGGGLNHG